VLFRQLFDPETSTYTYLLADEASREAVLIDTVIEQFERDYVLLRELDLELAYTLETHVHADHVTASGRFRAALGSQIAVGVDSGVTNADVALGDGDTVRFGSNVLTARTTPGHTHGCATYACLDAGMAFTGDALLIRGCGRTDFQQGDAATLFASIREKIFTLPDETLLYPGHDYRGRMVTTVSEEKRFNPRIGIDKSESDFVSIMETVRLAPPRNLEIAVPANLESGLAPLPESGSQPDAAASVADVMEQLGRQDADPWSGMGI